MAVRDGEWERCGNLPGTHSSIVLVEQRGFGVVCGIQEIEGESIDRIIDAVNNQARLIEALERLQFAAFCRENSSGDLCRLLEVKAELAAASSNALKVLNEVRGA